MYFSLDVKTRREDFFDMERELKTLKQELLDPATRMIVIKGLRRSGKSSLMRAALNLVKVPHIFIDPRSARPPTPESIYECFLVNCGFVEKRGELYSLANPLLTEAVKRGYV